MVEYDVLFVVVDFVEVVKFGVFVVWLEVFDNIVGVMFYGDVVKVDEVFVKVVYMVEFDFVS